MGIIAEENRVVYYDQENQPKGEVTDVYKRQELSTRL